MRNKFTNLIDTIALIDIIAINCFTNLIDVSKIELLNFDVRRLNVALCVERQAKATQERFLTDILDRVYWRFSGIDPSRRCRRRRCIPTTKRQMDSRT